MTRQMRIGGAVVCAAAVVMFAGCNKKQTKIAPSTEPAPVEKEEPVKTPEVQEFVPSENDVFEPLDMDAQMQEVLQPVYFDYDQSDLLPESISRLEKVAGFMSKNTTVRLLVEGHADERGTNEYNIGLGETRAKAVRQYLVSYGIKTTRLETTSYGRERPAIPNCSDDPCHARNRRVEWQVLAR